MFKSIMLVFTPTPSFETVNGRNGMEIEGVDPSCRELYLSDAEFAEVFGMAKAEFSKQPKWKQVAAKKEKELF